MQHSAGDRRPGGAERREPQSAGESAGGDGERQCGAGEERHRPPITGADRAGPERGEGTWIPVLCFRSFFWFRGSQLLSVTFAVSHMLL